MSGPATVERARAAAKELQEIPRELVALETMTARQLAQKYREVFGEPTRSNNRQYLKKRIGWRIQELAMGGLSQSALVQIKALGDGMPERWRRRLAQEAVASLPQAAASDTSTSAPATPPSPPRDPRLPPVGTVLTRIYRGATHKVTVLDDGFAYNGERFKTLSAVARHITGTQWNGFAFFKSDKTADTIKEAP